MDSRNLKYFIAVAQYGSISQAARAMYISQPQLSHIIKTRVFDTSNLWNAQQGFISTIKV